MIAGLASMAPGASVAYTCALPNVTAGFTNVATDTGMPPTGPDVSASASAVVFVTSPFKPPNVVVTHAAITHPSISITKDPKSQIIVNDGTAKFIITVKNTGDVTLTDVTVSDPLSSRCDNSLGVLVAGESWTYACARTDVKADFTNVAEAKGKPPTGPEVSASDFAAVTAPRSGHHRSPRSRSSRR
jgi:uncharacterized repeat protein (TIGR01451 family)